MSYDPNGNTVGTDTSGKYQIKVDLFDAQKENATIEPQGEPVQQRYRPRLQRVEQARPRVVPSDQAVEHTDPEVEPLQHQEPGPEDDQDDEPEADEGHGGLSK